MSSLPVSSLSPSTIPNPSSFKILAHRYGTRTPACYCLSSDLPQFFLRQEDVGKSRADAAAPRLAELNAYVPVRNLGGQAGQEITVDLIKGFQVCMLILFVSHVN